MTDELSRRGFLELTGAAGLSALGGETAEQLTADEGPDGFEGYGLLLGPQGARPPTGGQYLQQWDTYRFIYFATDSGEKSYITHQMSGWKSMPTPFSGPTTQVDEVKVENFRSQFNHTFARPNEPSSTRWNFSNVTADSPEVVLTGDASLSSKQRGNYAPGSESIAGVAFRLTGSPGTNQKATGGYYTADNGMLVGADSSGAFAEVRNNGTDNTVRLDGVENNGTLPPNFNDFQNYTRIVRFDHLFYRGGAIEVNILGYDGDTPKIYTVHTFTPENTPGTGTPIGQPNLPTAFNATSLTPELRVSAAHYEKGEVEGDARFGGEHASATFDASSWTHVISWRKKSNYDQTNVKPLYVNAFANGNNVKLEVQVDADLGDGAGGSPTFAPATHKDPTETPLEWVVGGDGAINANGDRVWAGHAPAGQGSSAGGVTLGRLLQNLDVGEVLTVAAQGYSGSGTVYVVPAQEAYY